MMTLEMFRADLAELPFEALCADVIGEGVMIPGLEGDVPLVYADYVASGRGMRLVERFVAEAVLPYYANSHSDASFCGAHITRMREAARAEIARLAGAGPEHAVIFAGSGATAGLNRLVGLLGVREAARPVALVGPYEHHSNLLPWRESGAEVVEIAEAPGGGPDLEVLAQVLADHAAADLVIGSFSAASNVSGIVTDVAAVTAVLKAHGALAVWDFAGGGPYLQIDMGAGLDAVVTSPHKFPGGPGASGVLILRRDVVRRDRPVWPGGGTVSFVSPWAHDYSPLLEEREEAGTPNVIGDIRAALVFLIKEAAGEARIAAREAAFEALARAAWAGNPHLQLLGVDKAPRLPIFSFVVRDGQGDVVSPQLFTRMLSDIYGIQARGGCACAGPYGHRLLGIGREGSEAMRAAVAAGQVEKPGWVRLNFGWIMTEATVRMIVAAVDRLSRETDAWRGHYDSAASAA